MQLKGDVRASPFQPLTSEPTPWPTAETAQANTTFATSSAPVASTVATEMLVQKRECVAALRTAYPEGTTIPQETQEIIDKLEKDIEQLEKDNNKYVTKNIHAATKSLGRAQKTLTETLDAKKAHRLCWVKHITEAVTT